VEFRQIRYALSVAKERSFTRAATRLAISQSAVSEQVKLLEEEIGFTLFRRLARGIEVTERGRSFLYEAERVVGGLGSLHDVARRLKGAPSETLTLGMGSGLAQLFMPRLFRDVLRTLPDVRIEILTAPTKSIFNELHEERIDAGIAIESEPERVPTGIVFDRLADTDMILIVHPNNPLARSRGPVDIGRLVGERIIMSELTVGYGAVVMSLFTDLGIRPNILAVADNVETQKVIVQTGAGVAIVPRPAIENEVALGTVTALETTPRCSVVLNLFRRRQPQSRRKENWLLALRDALRDGAHKG
jgi:DNA-binding transcriptional LysR family regulator